MRNPIRLSHRFRSARFDSMPTWKCTSRYSETIPEKRVLLTECSSDVSERNSETSRSTEAPLSDIRGPFHLGRFQWKRRTRTASGHIACRSSAILSLPTCNTGGGEECPRQKYAVTGTAGTSILSALSGYRRPAKSRRESKERRRENEEYIRRSDRGSRWGRRGGWLAGLADGRGWL